MKNIFLSSRNKSPHNKEKTENKEPPFFSQESKTPFFSNVKGAPVQAKLTVGQPGDKYEKEADSMADAVVNKTATPEIQNKEISSIQRQSLATPVEDEKLGTAEQRIEEDKLVQEKLETQKMEEPEEEMVNKMEGEEEEGMINKMDDEEEEAVQTKSNGKSNTASPGLSQQIKSKSGKGRSMSKNTQTEMESSFNTDFSDVNIHTDNDAIHMNKELGAQAFTHGKDVYFNSGKYSPESTEGKHLLAHELTHVVQQDSSMIRNKKLKNPPAKELKDSPAKKRKSLTISSSAVHISKEKIKEYFERLKNGNWGSTYPAPKGVKISLSGIKTDFKVPLTSLAMHMYFDSSYPSPVTGEKKNIFGPNQVSTVFLPLKEHGLANGIYRFSWIQKKKSGVIYIETLAGGAKAENNPSINEGVLNVGKLKFPFSTGWKASKLTVLKKALALIPYSALEKVDGLKFILKSSKGPEGEAGKYKQGKHEVHIFSNAFDSKDSSRSGVVKNEVRSIAHEIGHAIDIYPIDREFATKSKAKIKAAVSPSGSKWHVGASKKWELTGRHKKVDNTFRKVAKKDGLKAVVAKIKDSNGDTIKYKIIKGSATEYGRKSWEEIYAETFALYVTDPNLLYLIRPNIYKYFKKTFPRKKK